MRSTLPAEQSRLCLNHLSKPSTSGCPVADCRCAGSDDTVGEAACGLQTHSAVTDLRPEAAEGLSLRALSEAGDQRKQTSLTLAY